MVQSKRQAGDQGNIEITTEMRRAGAWAIEDLEGAGSLEDKAAAAYKAMVLLKTSSTHRGQRKRLTFPALKQR